MSVTAMPRTETTSGRLWAFVPAGILASLIGLQLLLVRGALSDPSFAVEDDYYAKAVSWDAKMAQDRENARLGFRADVALRASRPGEATVRLRLLDAKNRAVSGAKIEVAGFPVARSSHSVRAWMTEEPSGEYAATLPASTLGQWELRFDARRDADHFTATERRDLLPGGPAR
jgi:nitrogen fixation protein FixH